MQKSKLQPVTVGGNTDEIKAQFYGALRAGDFDKLMRCWVDDDKPCWIYMPKSELPDLALK
jgi:hypothetical protein